MPDLNSVKAKVVERLTDCGKIVPQANGSPSNTSTIECMTNEVVVTLLIMLRSEPLYCRKRPTCSGLQRNLGSILKSTGNSCICHWAFGTLNL